MFKNAYDDMIDKIQNEEIKEIPLKSSTMSMEIVDVSDNNNLILKAKGNNSKKTYIVSFNRLRKLSLVYKNIEALDSIQNIYKAVTDAIKGCHTSAYWATLYFLYKNFIHYNEIEEKRVERKNFVFIIDEINRGEISKIFGELFFSIDPGYRGETGKIQTQYQNLIEDGDVYEDGFYVPENVYIIGTMNDIDRSVDSMDFAMRRRFAWKEIKATDRIEMLDELSDLKNKAIEKMVNLNMAIEKTEGLNSSYHIGPAYFRKVMLYKDNPDTMWSYLWDYHIKGVLYEYVRGTEDIDIKMAAFEEACQKMEKNARYVSALRDKLTEGLISVPHSILNGDRVHRLPGIVNLCFEGIEGETLLLMLDADGICASSGSACTADSLAPSHVLLALGLPHEIARASLRLSIDELNTEEEIDRMIKSVSYAVSHLRKLSPEWKKLENGIKKHVLS